LHYLSNWMKIQRWMKVQPERLGPKQDSEPTPEARMNEMPKLTDRQQQILDLVQSAIERTGAPPTRAAVPAIVPPVPRITILDCIGAPSG